MSHVHVSEACAQILHLKASDGYVDKDIDVHVDEAVLNAHREQGVSIQRAKTKTTSREQVN